MEFYHGATSMWRSRHCACTLFVGASRVCQQRAVENGLVGDAIFVRPLPKLWWIVRDINGDRLLDGNLTLGDIFFDITNYERTHPEQLVAFPWLSIPP